MKRWPSILLLASACATTAKPPQGPRASAPTHVVIAGDTAYSIAKTYGVELSALLAANRLDDEARLSIGRTLVIPGGRGLEPPPPTTTTSTATTAEPDEDRALSEVRSQMQSTTNLSPLRCEGAPPPKAKVSSAGMIWPLEGVVVGKFGKRDGEAHDGLDIGAPEGTPFFAANAGEVLFSGEQSGYGLVVILRHADGRTSIYARASKNCVGAGQNVERGAIIGLVGKSAGADAPYLHFEVRGDKGPINPRPLLP